jgi:hypothetical protein
MGSRTKCANKNSQAAIKKHSCHDTCDTRHAMTLVRQAAKMSQMALPVTPALAIQNKHKQQQKLSFFKGIEK